MSRRINDRQDLAEFVRLRCASSVAYRRSRLAHQVRMGGILLLAAAGPLLSWAAEDAGAALSAITGIWLLIDRFFLSPAEEQERQCGAVLQEQHDSTLFDLPWNPSVAGRDDGPDNAHRLARKWPEKKVGPLRGWYPDVSGVVHSVGVLLCQRANAVWSRDDHTDYARVLKWVAIAWFVVLTVVAIAADASSVDAWVLVYLPSVPAFLQAIDLYRAHCRAATAKSKVLEIIGEALDGARNGKEPEIATLRRIQDGLFITRRDGVQVPRRLYTLTRKGHDETMREVAGELIAILPSELRDEKPQQ